MTDKQSKPMVIAHSLTLNSRNDFFLEGVEDVETFTAVQIILRTNMGRLVIKGKNLNITKLDVSSGEIRASGTVDSLTYSPMKKQHGMFNALFK